MTSIIKILFEKWLVGPSKDRPFLPMPWEDEDYWPDQKTSNTFPVYNFPLAPVLGICAFTVMVSVLIKAPLGASLAALLFCLGILAYKDSWEQSGALSITSDEKTIRVHENETFVVKLLIENQTPRWISPSFLYQRFDGSHSKSQIVALGKFAPYEKKILDFNLKADAGMGNFLLNGFMLITRDRYGLVRRCVANNLSAEVEVYPDFIDMPPINLSTSGKTAHSGSIESRFSGGSVNFLGNRFYKHGDSISRIDWKKSERLQTLVTREFELLNSTDATIFLDRRSIATFKHGTINSFEQAKDTVITIARSLMNQRVRVRLITDLFATEFGKADAFFDYLVEMIRGLEPHSGESFDRLLSRYQGEIPAYSVVFPVFSTVDIDPSLLTENFLMWDQLHTEIIPVIFDSASYETTITRLNRLEESDHSQLEHFKKLYFPHDLASSYSNIFRKLNEKSVIIGPNQTVGQVYAGRL